MTAGAAGRETKSSGVLSLSLGDIECLVVSDGALEVEASFMFRNASPDRLSDRLRAHGVSADRVPAGLSCLYFRVGGRGVLLDTGTGGRWHPGLGHLGGRLAAAGIERGSVDIVLLTHGHPDHIGGILDEEGQPTFPNARYVLTREEWRFWTSEESLGGVPEAWSDVAREVLPPIRDRVDLITEETEIAPGVRVFPAPGHTSGHMAVSIAGSTGTLLCVGDAVGHPITVEHPEWYVATDAAEEQTRSTRVELFERASAGGAVVFANHFAFPPLGHIERAGPGWRWNALAPGRYSSSRRLRMRGTRSTGSMA